MVHAIILAGGRSARMPGEILKQYRRVNNDKMLITYSIETFIRCQKIDRITVVIEDEAWEDMILRQCKHSYRSRLGAFERKNATGEGWIGDEV